MPSRRQVRPGQARCPARSVVVRQRFPFLDLHKPDTSQGKKFTLFACRLKSWQQPPKVTRQNTMFRSKTRRARWHRPVNSESTALRAQTFSSDFIPGRIIQTHSQSGVYVVSVPQEGYQSRRSLLVDSSCLGSNSPRVLGNETVMQRTRNPRHEKGAWVVGTPLPFGITKTVPARD